MLGQNVNIFLVACAVLPEFHLRQYLISERTRHNERGMAGSAPKIHQTAFGQHDDAPACGEYDMIHLRLDVVPLVLLNGSNIYFGIEVSNVTDDSLVLHSQHVVMRND